MTPSAITKNDSLQRPLCRLCAFFAVLLMASALTGCPNQSDVNQPKNPVESSSQMTLPVVTETEDELRDVMRQQEPFSPEFEEARIKLVILQDKIRKREGVEGFTKETPMQHAGNQAATIDEKTGKLAWRAMTCFNPDCPGRGKDGGPYLFAREFSNVSIGPDGKIVVGPLDLGELEKNPVVCPACGEGQFVRPYDPPETEIRRRQLAEQLAAARGSRGKGKRTVKEIMVELANLPKLFLVPEN